MTVLVIDFGAQYAQLIARRVREAGVYSVLVKPDISAAELQKLGGAKVIIATVTNGDAMSAVQGGLGVNGTLIVMRWASQAW